MKKPTSMKEMTMQIISEHAPDLLEEAAEKLGIAYVVKKEQRSAPERKQAQHRQESHKEPDLSIAKAAFLKAVR